MKQLLALMMILLAISLVSFRFASHPLYVDGKLVTHAHDKRKCSFQIIVKADGKVVANTNVDSTWHFALSFTPANEKSFDFLYIDSHHAQDTIFLKSYAEFESDQLEVTFYTFKGYLRVDEDDHVICPKCNKSDNVNPIDGLPGYYYCSGDKIKF